MKDQSKREQLKKIGFKEMPHFTILNSLVYDLGRNKELSFGAIDTPNEVLFIVDKEYDEISDAVCIRNYDFNGYTSVDEIKDLIKFLMKKKN